MSTPRIQYVRFVQAIGSPGYAGNAITKARLRTRDAEKSMPRDELMDEITIEGPCLVLRAYRLAPNQGKPGARTVLTERYTPLTNVIDFELEPEPEPAPRKEKQSP